MRVEKLKKKIRKMEWWERIELMDWLKQWYADMRAEEELMREEYEESNCICKYDMNDVNCPECY